MTPTFNDSALRVLARRQRELNRKPWLRPVEQLCGVAQTKGKLRRLHRKHRELVEFIHQQADQLQAAIMKTAEPPTARVDRITGTIEIGGRVQEWVLMNCAYNPYTIQLWVHQHLVCDGFSQTVEIHTRHGLGVSLRCMYDDLKPDPNFTPPGQYVEANGLKFWVEQGLAGMGIFMNNIPLFSIENDINQIYITPPVRKLTGANQFYPYTGCHCDTCGGGE